jgi:glycosyltransferase involved in cell wall biosynthesis
LADRAKVSGAKKVVVLPTVIDIDVYKPKINFNNSKIVIGWIGSPSTFKYIKNYKTIFSKILQKNKVELHIVGATEDLGLGSNFKYLKWTEESEVNLISNFDIGIMPLENTPWELGKCAYKLIQYMGCGVPVIASAVGMNTEVVEDGINGFLVQTEEQWLEKLNLLIEDTAMRTSLGKKGRIKVESDFSLKKNCEIVVALLNNE